MSEKPGRRRVLVVDDEPRIIHFIRLNLEHDGFTVSEAASGTRALEQLRDQLPDLILLDVMMPDLDGFETLRPTRSAATPRRGPNGWYATSWKRPGAPGFLFL